MASYRTLHIILKSAAYLRREQHSHYQIEPQQARARTHLEHTAVHRFIHVVYKCRRFPFFIHSASTMSQRGPSSVLLPPRWCSSGIKKNFFKKKKNGPVQPEVTRFSETATHVLVTDVVFVRKSAGNCSCTAISCVVRAEFCRFWAIGNGWCQKRMWGIIANYPRISALGCAQ